MSLADFVVCSGTGTTAAGGTLVYTNPKITAGCIAVANFTGAALTAGATACAIVATVAAGQVTFTVANAATLTLVAVALPFSYVILNPNFVTFSSS